MDELFVHLVVGGGLLVAAAVVEAFVRSRWPGWLMAALVAGYSLWLGLGVPQLLGRWMAVWFLGVLIVYGGLLGERWRRELRDRAERNEPAEG